MRLKDVSLMIAMMLALSHAIAEPTAKLYQRTFKASQFDHVVADGYFNLHVSSTSGKYASVVTKNFYQAPIAITVHDHVLYILSSREKYRGYGKQHPAVDLQVPANVTSLVIHGPTNVVSHIASAHLKLVADGYGIIQAKDIQGIQTIYLKGSSILHIAGIHTDKLAVYLSGSSQLTLQGKVNTLYARLDDDATLRARGLAAENVTVQAKYNAQAYVYPLKTLRAFAEDAGAVYYYKHLNNLTSYPVQSGNVLQMKW